MNKSDLKIILANIKTNEILKMSEADFLSDYYSNKKNKNAWLHFTVASDYDLKDSDINIIFKEMKNWKKYFDNNGYPKFLYLSSIFCNIEKSNKIKYNDLIYIIKRSYLTKLSAFELFDSIINFYYKTFNNDKKIIIKLDNYNSILNRIKIDVFKEEFNNYIKETNPFIVNLGNKNKSLGWLTALDDKNQEFVWRTGNFIELFDYLYKTNIINEKMAKIYFSKIYERLNNVAKNEIFYLFVTKCSDNFKEFLIKNYFKDMAINELLNPNDDNT